MMTNAMELASCCGGTNPGSRGSFKQASIICMGVLRETESRSSLLAMLEAFLYDPLLTWTVSDKPRPSQCLPRDTGRCDTIRASHRWGSAVLFSMWFPDDLQIPSGPPRMVRASDPLQSAKTPCKRSHRVWRLSLRTSAATRISIIR